MVLERMHRADLSSVKQDTRVMTRDEAIKRLKSDAASPLVRLSHFSEAFRDA